LTGRIREIRVQAVPAAARVPARAPTIPAWHKWRNYGRNPGVRGKMSGTITVQPVLAAQNSECRFNSGAITWQK